MDVEENNVLKQRALSHMEDLVKYNKVFIDTCTLMHYNCNAFMEEFIPLLVENNNKMIIPTRVIEELEKHASNSERNPKAGARAQNGLEIVEKLKKYQVVDFRGEDSDNFADNVFTTVFSKHRLNYRLLLITQDGALAEDIFSLNNIKSARGYPVSVKRVNKYGCLGNFVFSENVQKHEKTEENNQPNTTSRQSSSRDHTQSQHSTPGNHRSDQHALLENEKFKLKREVAKISNEMTNITKIPQENDYVICDNQKIKLVQLIASGGEGSVYETNTPYVCKIYKKNKNEKSKYEKIKLMVSKRVDYEGICWPIAMVYNESKEFAGYLMPKASGKELQRSLFVKPLLLKNFPHWKKRDTVELCLTILEKIQFLHDRNIILGDINPMNILVVNPKEVYFVDTDSYQIEGFPCPVGTINYTAPEIQKKKFPTFLRSFGNENFAVATLLFMIMLPGKPPYSQQGGESPVDNIINMDFSYPFGEQSNRKAPDGPWRYMWSHMPYYIKESFYMTFRKDEPQSFEKTRLSVEDWHSKMAYYLKLLDSGKLAGQDDMSIELFPTRHKKNANMEYVNCKLCGEEVAEDYCQEGMCRECLNTGETYKCNRCSKEMLFTNYAKLIKKSKKHRTCPECFESLNEVYTTEHCNDCGSVFEITNGEYEYFESKSYDLPKRCKPCRANSRSSSPSRTRSESDYKTDYSGPDYYEDYGSSDYYDEQMEFFLDPFNQTGSRPPRQQASKSSRCFITTAVCEFLNKPDDCYELTQFRGFRDSWLANQPGGQEMIKEYYDIAPRMVENINKSNKRQVIYTKLWDEYLQPCLSYIERNKYEDCKDLYVTMVKSLKLDFYY